MNEFLFVNSQDAENAADAKSPVLAPGEVMLGTLVSIDINGNPQVSFAGMSEEGHATALSTVAITHQHIGRQVALLFANADLSKPIIMGIIYSPLNDLLENFSILQNIEVAAISESEQDIDPFAGNKITDVEKKSPIETVRVDGKRVVIEGQEEIVLTCGESSITLTKAGKILIRGKYLLSRSSGVNRILGGSVQVN